METILLYILLVYATLLENYGAKTEKTVYASKIKTLQPKLLLQKNYSDSFFNAELTKLNKGIAFYKKRIEEKRKEFKNVNKKIERLMPQKCKNIECPFEEKPVCAKFFYKDSRSKPFHVRMVNECEMNYVKCHRDLESKIVPMINCHSVIDNLQEDSYKGEKRSKRSVGGPEKTVSTIKSLTKKKPITGPKKTILKTKSETSIPLSNTSTKLKTTANTKHAKTLKSDPETTTNGTLTSMNPTAAPIKVKAAKKKFKTKLLNVKPSSPKLNETREVVNNDHIENITTQNNNTEHVNIEHVVNKNDSEIEKVNLKKNTGKNIESHNKGKRKRVNVSHLGLLNRTISKLNLTLNPKHKVAGKHRAPHKSIVKQKLKNTKPHAKTKIGHKINVHQKLNSAKIVKKIRPKKSHLRQANGGNEYFEKNLGSDKMFTSDVFTNDKEDHRNLKNDNGPSITGTIEIDDDLMDQKEMKPNLPENGNDLEGVMKIDMSAIDKISGGTNINSGTNVPDPKLTDNKNDNAYIEGEIEIDDNDMNLGSNLNNPQGAMNTNLNKEEFIEGEIEVDDNDMNLGSNLNNPQGAVNTNFNNEEHIEGEIEIDDESPNNMNVGTNVNKHSEDLKKDTNGDYITGSIEIDDNASVGINVKDHGDTFNADKNSKDQNEQFMEGEIDIDDNQAQNMQGIMDIIQNYTGPPPLVDEPKIINENEPFNDDEDYRYEPSNVPPIVTLDVEKDFPLPPTKPNQLPTITKQPITSTNAIIIPVTNDPIEVQEKPNDKYSKRPSKNQHSDEVNMEEYNADCPKECPSRDVMVCAVCNHGVYRTFLSVCHIRMYRCAGHQDEHLELVSRYPCVMSAPLITDNPQMRPKGRISEPGDEDLVIRFVRCREKGLLGKNAKCTFDAPVKLNQGVEIKKLLDDDYYY